MKILYGIQGTGNGHLARARALVPELRKQGIDIDFVFSGRKREDFFDMSIFGEDFLYFDGLTLMTELGRVNKLKTLMANNMIGLLKDISKLRVTDYDLVLSDFEPISAWAAKIQGVPSMGISHQCAFDHAIPKVTGYRFDRLLMRYFAPTQHRIGLHWHHFDQPIFPPLIEKQTAGQIKPHKILVYMGFEAVNPLCQDTCRL